MQCVRHLALISLTYIGAVMVHQTLPMLLEKNLSVFVGFDIGWVLVMQAIIKTLHSEHLSGGPGGSPLLQHGQNNQRRILICSKMPFHKDVCLAASCKYAYYHVTHDQRLK
ncbi:hypothetical protein N7495_002796 [Penicillium taxi]|uniref:uncharacterized protein n=1 Tax=Penicillium taxi TaxID=168475 RepID=UPI002545ACFF|nr:uncharacterized protein N7495_002796 [Penicillium taxi]KAJ5902268.1 hypothetical protein N7495_002796 [Penicillium taxi]